MRTRSCGLLLCALVMACSVPAQAQRPAEGRAPGRVEGRAEGARVAPAGPMLNLDSRYHHDHYYPRPGQLVPQLPGGAVGIHAPDGDWFFHGGVWFRGSAGRFVVTAPPIGIIVPFLPSAYVTLWVNGAPYYYANGIYYSAVPGQGYAVVAQPDAVASVEPTIVAPPTGRWPPVIYPRFGQPPGQVEADRAACMYWASALPFGSDPYLRAFQACMDGRGYTVR